ncbi:MAG: general secretion pathway protein GspK [Verrucomicrobia subdivision 3 bacterium]|nr:general secretion pathway protein GspK [Limisphaerales bacterium]
MTLIPSRRNSGIALIIVLLVVTVLGLMAIHFGSLMKVETKLARNSSFDNEFDWIARSGVEAAKYVLAADLQGPSGQLDALNEIWAGGPGVDTNDMAAQFPLAHFEIGPRRSVDTKIIDLDRKFNINVADETILRQAMTLIGVDPAAQATIIDSILDWCDRDMNSHTRGVESDFYKSGQGYLGIPYVAKDGPIDDLSELLLINGVTDGIYLGSGAGLRAFSDLRQASRSRFDEPIYTTGLRDLFTALSGRSLNINTASATTLQLLPPIDENVAHAIIQRRAGPDGTDGTLDDTPFRSPAEIGTVPGLPPPVLQQFARFFTTRSIVFEATVVARIGSDTRTYTAVLRRNSPRDIQILTMSQTQ